MDETQPDSEGEKPEAFNWHIGREELLAMSQEDRDLYLNEKTSRLYEAITMISRADGAPVSRQDIELILNPEEMESRQQGFDERGDL